MYSLIDSMVSIIPVAGAVSVIETGKRKIILIEYLENQSKRTLSYEFKKTNSSFLKDDTTTSLEGSVHCNVFDSSNKKAEIFKKLDISKATVRTWAIKNSDISRLVSDLDREVKNPPKFISVNNKGSNLEGLSLDTWVKNKLSIISVHMPPEGDPNFGFSYFSLPTIFDKIEDKELIEAVCEASKANSNNYDLDNLRRAINKGGNINCKVPGHYWKTLNGVTSIEQELSELTPLMIACMRGSLRVARFLVDEGADIDRAINNKKRVTALDLAIQHKQDGIILYLYSLDAKHNGIPKEITGSYLEENRHKDKKIQNEYDKRFGLVIKK